MITKFLCGPIGSDDQSEGCPRALWDPIHRRLVLRSMDEVKGEYTSNVILQDHKSQL